MKQTLFISTIILLSLFGCKKDKETLTVDLGHDYFPLDTTFYRIYNIDSIIHDDNDDKQGIIDTFKYQIKEVFGSIYKDQEGRTTYKISRYYRKNETKNWTIKEVWKANFENTYIEVQENNIRLMKLNFPVKINKTWDGNSLNADSEKEFEYILVNEPYALENLNFDSTTTVLQLDEENVIERAYEQEVYAKNIGLIFREKTFIDIQNQSGSEYFQALVEYGNE